MAAGVLGVVAVIVGYSAYTFCNMSSATVQELQKVQDHFGDEHEHASFL